MIVFFDPGSALASSWTSLKSSGREGIISRELDHFEKTRKSAAPRKSFPLPKPDDPVGPTGYQTATYSPTPRAARASPVRVIENDRRPSLPLSSTWALSAGYRRDELDWNIAGDSQGRNPNVALENAWEGLDIYQIKSQHQIRFTDPVFIDAAAAFGWIRDGENRESEFSLDNRQNEFLRSLSQSDDGYTMDLSLGLGYTVFRSIEKDFWDLDELRLSFLGGYSYHQQNLTMTDGVQVIDINDFFGLGSFSGLDSSYETRWLGPWLGMEFFGRKDKYFSNLRLEYHWADYEATGDLNLRPDVTHPESYRHDADGKGFVANLGWGMDVSSRWQLSLNADYQKWSTGEGVDRIFFLDGTTQDSLLNEVNWSSCALMMAATYRFD